jgi:hypothetical protein
VIVLAAAAAALAGCGGGSKGLARSETRFFRFQRPQAWQVNVVRPAKPSHPGEIIARSLGAPSTKGDRPLLAVDAMPGWTASLDGLASAVAFDDRASDPGYRELGRSTQRVKGAPPARLIKGEASGKAGEPVRVFDLLALSKGHLAVHLLLEVPKADLGKVPVQDILSSLELRT